MVEPDLRGELQTCVCGESFIPAILPVHRRSCAAVQAEAAAKKAAAAAKKAGAEDLAAAKKAGLTDSEAGRAIRTSHISQLTSYISHFLTRVHLKSHRTSYIL